MTLDTELLKRAGAAEKVLAEAERQSLLARAEYNTLVRRMHLAGASLREIAGAIGMSHQRVQQIVNASGGSWWRRVWRNRSVGRDAVCTYCERPPSEVAKLIAGPNVYICDSCVSLAEHTSQGAAHPKEWTIAPRNGRLKCSFCKKGRTVAREVVVTRPGNICVDCLGTCREILNSR